MPPRSRWTGSVPELADAIGEKVANPGDIDYDESEKPVFNNDKLFKDPIQSMLRNLHLMDERINFKKSDIQAALVRLYSRHPEWPQTDQAKADFKRHVTKRAMNAIDHFKKAFCRAKPARWACQLLEGRALQVAPAAPAADSDTVEADVVDGSGDEIPAAQDTFFYGWSKKLKRAWRAPHDRPEAKEHTADLQPGLSDMMPIVAKFPDGDFRTIPGCLTATLKAMQESAEAARPAAVVYFRGTGKDGEPVVVKRRLDGTTNAGGQHIITSMYLGSKQKCQCPVNEKYSEKDSIDIMTKVADEFCKGLIEESNLYQARDYELQARGYDTPKSKAKKRPAAEKSDDKDNEKGSEKDKEKHDEMKQSSPPEDHIEGSTKYFKLAPIPDSMF